MPAHPITGARPLSELRPARPLSELRELVVHLATREVSARHRFTLLGWAWPLARQLAQLAVLVLIFDAVLDLGIQNYPAFVFSGLVAWTWFATGTSEAAKSMLTHRHLVFQPRCPTVVLPVVAVAVAFVDVLLAVPVLLAMLAAIGELHPTALLAPALVAIQLGLMCGIAWIVAAATVYLRDVAQVVLVGLTVLFYLTPVFYDLARVPPEYEWILRLNPMSTLIEAYRDALLDGRVPGAAGLAAVAGAAGLLAATGLALFRRLEPGFVDEL